MSESKRTWAAWCARRWASFWLRALFWLTSAMPWVPRVLKPMMVWFAWRSSGQIQRATRANARRLIGEGLSQAEARSFGLRVVARFYDAILEFGANRSLGPEELSHRLIGVEGEEKYREARRRGRGAILVTAHLGSFETAIGMLRRVEPRVHVVFERDSVGVFEKLRSRQRERLGVIEAAVDDGLSMWMGLRDALAADEVVLFQGDRCMPGQRGVLVPFLGGHMRLPTGPIRLSRMTGSPIIPVFAVSEKGGRVRVVHGEPIYSAEHAEPERGAIDAMLVLISGEIERVVKENPDQWLCLHAVLEEDRGG